MLVDWLDIEGQVPQIIPGNYETILSNICLYFFLILLVLTAFNFFHSPQNDSVTLCPKGKCVTFVIQYYMHY